MAAHDALDTILDDERREARAEARRKADEIRTTIDDERPTPADLDGLAI